MSSGPCKSLGSLFLPEKLETPLLFFNNYRRKLRNKKLYIMQNTLRELITSLAEDDIQKVGWYSE